MVLGLLFFVVVPVMLLFIVEFLDFLTWIKS